MTKYLPSIFDILHHNLIFFVIKSLTLGILFSTALRAEVVFKRPKLAISP